MINNKRNLLFITTIITILHFSLTDATSDSVPNMSTSTKEKSAMKTIYLIRHAESEENRRLGSLKSAFLGLGKFKLPKKQDVYASMELLNVSAQIDSDVSEKGQEQVREYYHERNDNIARFTD